MELSAELSSAELLKQLETRPTSPFRLTDQYHGFFGYVRLALKREKQAVTDEIDERMGAIMKRNMHFAEAVSGLKIIVLEGVSPEKAATRADGIAEKLNASGFCGTTITPEKVLSTVREAAEEARRECPDGYIPVAVREQCLYDAVDRMAGLVPETTVSGGGKTIDGPSKASGIGIA